MKLMLIGGGSNGHNNHPYETKEIDEEVVRMTNKENPVFLFIGLASSFSDSYYDVMKEIYKKLGCKTTYLKKSNIVNNPDIVRKKISEADIIYMSGGDTTKLVRTLKEYHIDELLFEAADRGCVLSGISAGANAIAKNGLSDYQIINNISENYTFTGGLGILDIDICPHADDLKRQKDLKTSLKDTNKKVLALDNGTALKIEDENFTIVKSLPNAKARLVYWENNSWIEEEYSQDKIKIKIRNN